MNELRSLVNKADAARFLNALAGRDDAQFTFQVFHDKGEKPDIAGWRHGTLTECWDWLVAKNAEGCGIFVTINATDGNGRRRANVTHARASFVDLDGAPLPVSPTIQPDIVVRSSPGRFHAYWIIEPEDDLNKWSALQAQLAAHFGGDPKVIDPPRVLRLPGFSHQKGDPQPVEIVHCAPEWPHAIAALQIAYPATFKAPAERSAATVDRTPIGDLDSADRMDKAIAFLQAAAPSIEGQGGNDHAYNLGCELSDIGLSPEGMVEAAFESGWNDRCAPPWPEAELLTVFKNAARYKANPPGSKSIEAVAAEFGGVPIDPKFLPATDDNSSDRQLSDDGEKQLVPKSVKKPADPFRAFKRIELLALPSPKWLIRGLIVQGGLVCIYGKPKSGKTLWASEMACCMATGQDFFGLPVVQGRCLYIIAEGNRKLFGYRIDQWCTERAGGDATRAAELRALIDANLDIVPVAVMIDNADQVAALLRRHPGERAFIVIDTLFRNMGGDSMNATDFQRFVAGCDLIRQVWKATVVFAHHMKRNDAKGAFGSIVNEASVDLGLRVTGKKRQSILKIAIMRDGDPNQQPWIAGVEERVIDDPALTEFEVSRIAVLAYVGRGSGQQGEDLLKLIDDFEPKTIEELIALTGGRPKRTVERRITKLREQGLIELKGLTLTKKGVDAVVPDDDDFGDY